jgi:membrane protease YdiL (CAAX protease family)
VVTGIGRRADSAARIAGDAGAMTIITAPEAPFHRLARNHAHRWWRPLAGTLYVAAAFMILSPVLWLLDIVAALLAGRPLAGGEFTSSFGSLGDVALACLTLALLIPVIFSAARWLQRRHAGSLSSVTGRLRWRWLLTCFGIATVAIVVLIGGNLWLTSATSENAGMGDSGWVGISSFLISAAVLVLVVPLQAAAEEYAMRGWLLQAVGSVVRSPWVAIGVQAVAFAALHGWGTPWGFTDLLVFAVLAGWLTIRTGGIEAAIALHVTNNLMAFLLGAAFGALSADGSAADAGWQQLVVNVPVHIVFTLVILRLARRRGLAVVSPPAPLPVLPPTADVTQPGHPVGV